MADDRVVLMGRWKVSIKEWIWEYEFLPDGTVKWKDTRSQENGTGRWNMSSSLVNIWWQNSSTRESWQLPLAVAPNKRTWYAATYYTGPYLIEKPIDSNLPRTIQPDPLIEIDTGNPASESNYIDRLCTHVAYGIYNGGFWVYVPESYSPHPIEIPEKMLYFKHTGSPVSDRIYGSQASALEASGGVNPDRITYYEGVGGKIICPTAFTYKTAPTIVNTANLVVDELIKEVTEELKDLMMMLVLRVAVSTTGSVISRASEVRRLKARDARAKDALENARRAKSAKPSVPTLRPRATPAQLREMLKNPDDWFVWATHDAGLVENKEIMFTGKTNYAANEKIHLLRGTDGIRGTKYGPNKVAIKIGSQHVSHFKDNEYLTEPIAPKQGVHFYQSDLNGL